MFLQMPHFRILQCYSDGFMMALSTSIFCLSTYIQIPLTRWIILVEIGLHKL